jgi:hypothetical protein
MVSWEYFRRRRKLDVLTWLKNSNVTSYDTFCAVLQGLGVRPPDESVYREYVPKPVQQKRKPRKKPAVKKADTDVPSAAKKPSRRRTSSTSKEA